MVVLAVDTASVYGRVAIAKEGEIFGALFPARRTGSEHLMPTIKFLAERAGVKLRDVDVFGVCVGPGSLTGIKIGMSAVLTMAELSGRKVVPFTSFDVFRMWGLYLGLPCKIVPFVPGKRGEIICLVDGEVKAVPVGDVGKFAGVRFVGEVDLPAPGVYDRASPKVLIDVVLGSLDRALSPEAAEPFFFYPPPIHMPGGQS